MLLLAKIVDIEALLMILRLEIVLTDGIRVILILEKQSRMESRSKLQYSSDSDHYPGMNVNRLNETQYWKYL